MNMPAPMTEPETKKHYPEVEQQANYPRLEEAALEYWRSQGTFQRSVDQRSAGAHGSNEYVFYDGPPFANGLPHYGHLLTGYVKDVVPRYQTMRGKRVERRFGWDCHGLPAEMEAEKALQVSGREAITAFGIDKYNDACRQSVLRYTKEWQNYVTRQARWVDFEHDYKTMDRSYMESVIWAFKKLWDKGLVYEGHRVMPYSWAMQTPVSNHEMRMDDATRPRQDPAITVAFRLDAKPSDPGPIDVLVFTTTPWTLPSNLALAVGSEIDYSIVLKDGRHYLIGSAVLKDYEKELADHTWVAAVKGRDLVGRSYTPLFAYFASQPNSFRVLSGEFVETTTGTGIVHMAPGFGEDDQKVCEQNGIKLVCPVDDRGCFTSEVREYAGMLVFDANKDIIKLLRDRSVLLRSVTITHEYPHCWRTRLPLIYKAISGAWFVKVTAIKDRMLANNQQIHWIPERIKDGQFGKWLENARDWSISRNRFWGSPIPVWKSDDPNFPRVDVYGSIQEMERDFGVTVEDLHRPAIDQLTRKNPDDPTGKSIMRRVPEVLDCWFESGSMPFAQVHYPFENKEWFESHFPADFIVEYVAQTRGWFYTLVVLATALFDKPPFRNVICHGVVLDENAQKLSKSLKNYPDPEKLFATTGSDALRWFLMSSPILRGGDLQIDKDGKQIAEVVRLVLNPIWNAYYFFTLYANTDRVQAKVRTDQQGLLDRYVLSKTRVLVEGVQLAMDGYEIAQACQAVKDYLDALNNWWIRRSRERFWGETGPADRQDAYDTLYTCLTTLCRVAAPLLPLLCETVYRGLTASSSVHLQEWPDTNALPADRALVQQMDRVRDACSVGLSLREGNKLRTRLPLAKVTLAGAAAASLRGCEHLLQDELNVKHIEFAESIDAFANLRVQVDAKTLGPKLGGRMKDVLAATRTGEFKLLPAGKAELAGVVLEAGEFELKLVPKAGVACASLSTNDVVVVLDTMVTEVLEHEGMARDFVRLVQQARKDAGLHVSDRILLWAIADPLTVAVLQKHVGYVKEQVLAVALTFDSAPDGAFAAEGKVGSGTGAITKLGITKV
ncbi:MAG: isoleucine--tRNA ligase [Planctomycetota bacterium]|nr:isoleucine--tRNA ligase [Planctomycetota bacterium]